MTYAQPLPPARAPPPPSTPAPLTSNFRLERSQWEELPVSVREAIEEHTGPVTDSALGGAGFRTGMRLILHTETGDVFVKGVGPDAGEIERNDLDLGAELAPFVPA